MKQVFRFDALGPPVVLAELIIAGMLGQNVISDRATISIKLDTHSDFVSASLCALVLFFVDQIRLEELQRESILVACVVDQANQALTIARHRLGDQRLGIDERHFPVDGTVSDVAPSSPFALDDIVRASIERAVNIHRLFWSVIPRSPITFVRIKCK